MEPPADEIVDAMHRAVEETPSLKKRFNAVVEFCISDGINVTNGKIDVSKNKKGTDGTADLVASCDLTVFHKLLNKKIRFLMKYRITADRKQHPPRYFLVIN